MGEGQWRLDDKLRGRLDELDAETEKATVAGDEQAVRASLAALHAFVRESGEQLDHDHLGASDLVVPPEDLSLDEARELLHGEGLIPELP
jgi:hypothetical protein